MKLAIECFVLAPELPDLTSPNPNGAASEQTGRAVDGVQNRGLVCRQLPRYQIEGPPTQAVRLLLTKSAPAKPLLIHSTSWRHDEATGFLLTTFVAVYSAPVNIGEPLEPVAFDGPHEAIAPDQTHVIAGHALHHGLRHLSFLSGTDPSVREALIGAGLLDTVQEYRPEPAGNLRHYAA